MAGAMAHGGTLYSLIARLIKTTTSWARARPVLAVAGTYRPGDTCGAF